MRKLGMLTLLAIAVCSTGCVAVSAKGNRWGTRYQVFVVKDQVMVFDSTTGGVAKVDITNPPPFEPRTDSCEPQE